MSNTSSEILGKLPIANARDGSTGYASIRSKLSNNLAGDKKASLFESLLAIPFFRSPLEQPSTALSSGKDSAVVPKDESLNSHVSETEGRKESPNDSPLSPTVTAAVIPGPPIFLDAKNDPQSNRNSPSVAVKPSQSKPVVTNPATTSNNPLKQVALKQASVKGKSADVLSSAAQTISISDSSLPAGSVDSASPTIGLPTKAQPNAEEQPAIAEVSRPLDHSPQVAVQNEKLSTTVHGSQPSKDQNQLLQEQSGVELTKSSASQPDEKALTTSTIATKDVNSSNSKKGIPSSKLADENDNSSSTQPQAPSPINRRSDRLADVRRDSRFNNNRNDDSKSDESSQPNATENDKGSHSKTDTLSGSTNALKELPDQVAKASVNSDSAVIPDSTTSAVLTPVSQSIDLGASGNAVSDAISVTIPLGLAVESRTPSLGSQEGVQGVTTVSSASSLGAFTTSGRAANSQPAGSSQSGTTSTGLSKYQEQRVLQRALKGIEKLQDGSSPLRIRLHPPELGSMQVTMRLSDNQVVASIEVEHPAAKEVLLQNLPTLQSNLKDQGFEVADFQVQVVESGQFSSNQSGMNTNGQSNSSWNDQASQRSSRYASMMQNRVDSTTSRDLPVPDRTSRLWSRGGGKLDVSV